MSAQVSAPLFLLRSGLERDLALVRSSWLASNRSSPAVRGMETALYRAEERAKIASLLARSRVDVAHATGDEDAILGWSCVDLTSGDRPTIHYVYVKHDARRLGIATSLLAMLLEQPCWYTNLPSVRGAVSLPKAWEYNVHRGYR